jgi:glutaminyl-tRNA synthetase
MYDFAHGYCDAIEGITHSICTLEFEDHRPLYDWFLEAVGYEDNHRPHQYEFARLNVTYTVLSKRKLQKLVYENHVSSWTDPRMPTISGMRRRGFTPNGLRKFCQNIGVTKNNSVVDVALLEHAIREDLNESTPRVMAVLNPIKVIIENYPEDQEEFFDAPYYPEGEEQSNQFGSRQLPFSRELWIDKDDFKEIAPKKWFRLAVGAEVRLRYACLLTCQSVVKDEQGEIIELRCTWDPASKGGNAPDGRKVKGTIHWVSAKHAKTAEVRLYDRLFLTENPGKDKADFLEDLNPNSLEIIEKAYIEPSLSTAKDGDRFQFERVGYFVVDQDSQADHLVFNRTLTLKDAWAKLEKKEEL